MERTETFLSTNNQQLDEITRLLQERDACNDWNSHSIEREDGKGMRRLEKDAKYETLRGHLEMIGMEVERLAQSGDMLPEPTGGRSLFGAMHMHHDMVADTNSLMKILQQNHQNRIAEIIAFGEGMCIYLYKNINFLSKFQQSAISRSAQHRR